MEIVVHTHDLEPLLVLEIDSVCFDRDFYVSCMPSMHAPGFDPEDDDLRGLRTSATITPVLVARVYGSDKYLFAVERGHDESLLRSSSVVYVIGSTPRQ